ncbi:trans-aconitate 2-methyltransferase [Ideonella sp. BN130291]|uniref:trans-aconitate 2-methyltransferase n=1 Tax=Ideonella sp. BN130291 TaxID=3112940 RepID=UPI002E276C62|nr:trans-aconitate 2-methyltransferase [Ideonella sp. BN130291]
MRDWNPALYTCFEDERTRPAVELLARVPLQAAQGVFDLGCGPGNSTELLVRRFPQASVVGTDNSPAMLEAARSRLPQVRFELSDIRTWQAEAADLIYANASLQWLPGHDTLLPRLFGMLAPGGVLAVQMPDNLDEPSHRLMRETAADARWAALIGDAATLRARILPADAYYDLLAPGAASVDIWRTTYHHRMGSPADIVQWLRGTGLKPFVDALPAPLQAEFLHDYEQRIGHAYSRRADGSRLLAFPRLFIVAQRGA